MTKLHLNITENDKYSDFPFYKKSLPLENSPRWGMTLKKAGSMRFRWNEINENRNRTLNEIAPKKQVCQIQLEHTKIVYAVSDPYELSEKIGDGIITVNKNLMPVVTVADCVPIYLFDEKTGAFGVVHSGWKGTGIIEKAIMLSEEKYSSKRENLYISIGAHIHSSCYIVNEERAEYFSKKITPECVSKLTEEEYEIAKKNWNNGAGKLYHLSLEKANLSILKKNGIKDENITILDECTASNKLLGSNRRETQENNAPDKFTVQAAYIYC